MNKIGIFVVLVAVCVAISFAAPSPPVISETFSANLDLTVTFHRYNSTPQTGKGYIGSDYHAGRMVERAHFGHDSHPLNFYRLARFDLHRSFEVIDNARCVVHPLEGHMPEIWGWLKSPHTTYSRETYQGQTYNTWSVKEGYSHVTLAVDHTNTPVYLWTTTPERNITTRFTNWTHAAPHATVFDIPSKCHGQQGKDEPVSCVARALMMQRAAHWVANKVPYNQGGTYEGYREDCSGYVSMCWGASKPGLDTRELHIISHPIAKSQLMEGDVLLCAGEHVVLFGGWTDNSQTHYTAYEETRPGVGTIKDVVPYPYRYNTGCFKPYRYNAAC